MFYLLKDNDINMEALCQKADKFTINMYVVVLLHLATLLTKNLWRRYFLKKFANIFQNSNFLEHLWTTDSIEENSIPD